MLNNILFLKVRLGHIKILTMISRRRSQGLAGYLTLPKNRLDIDRSAKGEQVGYERSASTLGA